MSCTNVQHHFDIIMQHAIKHVIHITPAKCTYNEITQHCLCLLILSECSWSYMNVITPCPDNKSYNVLFCGSIILHECLNIFVFLKQLFKIMQYVG
jgi:hypothetical protein